MNGAVFLHIASVVNNDLSPVAAQGSTRADIDSSPDNHIPRYSRIRMNECGIMYDRANSPEFKDIGHMQRI
jgi:hypothetical protein